MGALFFEGMNYDVNSACRLRPKSLNHDVGGTFFNFDISRVSALRDEKDVDRPNTIPASRDGVVP